MRLGVTAAALRIVLLVVPAFALGQGVPFGRWLTEDRHAVISIEPCNGSLCGRIVGLPLDHPDDPIPVDHDGKSQCGQTIIMDAVRNGAGWMVHIVDPRDGQMYQALLDLDGTRLKVRGYIGIPLFGHTQVWTLFPGPVPDSCRLPPRGPN